MPLFLKERLTDPSLGQIIFWTKETLRNHRRERKTNKQSAFVALQQAFPYSNLGVPSDDKYKSKWQFGDTHVMFIYNWYTKILEFKCNYTKEAV